MANFMSFETPYDEYAGPDMINHKQESSEQNN